MSVCAVMLVKDEADIIVQTVRHLATQVDRILVQDNGSTDGTREHLANLQEEGLVTVDDDPEVGYFQSIKTSSLALRAFHLGYDWVIPCDADEIWYAPDGRAIRDYLAGVAPDVRVVRARLFNHLPTGLDDPEDTNPITRIQWRQREYAPLGKVCARTGVDLWIEMGNHSAQFEGRGLTVEGLAIRHFSWRSVEQYVKKIRNGERAYAATNMPEDVGAHWRMFRDHPDEAIVEQYKRWFYFEDPTAIDDLVLDPAPVRS